MEARKGESLVKGGVRTYPGVCVRSAASRLGASGAICLTSAVLFSSELTSTCSSSTYVGASLLPARCVSFSCLSDAATSIAACSRLAHVPFSPCMEGWGGVGVAKYDSSRESLARE